MNERRFPLTYELRAEDPPLTADEIMAMGRGGCDAMILLSMLYPADGSFSLLVVSKDGRTGDEVTDAEIFKCWAMLAKRLADSSTLSPNKRELARTLWEVWREAVLGARGS